MGILRIINIPSFEIFCSFMYINLQDSLDDVEAILKRHLDFEKSLMVQDKLLKSFSDSADKLINNNHYDSR